MSTTRWIIETPCEHGEQKGHWLEQGESAVREWTNQHGRMCLGGSRIVVDPDNLPPEAIQRAAKLIPWHLDDQGERFRSDAEHLAMVEAAVTAFLSDPEPGDQT